MVAALDAPDESLTYHQGLHDLSFGENPSDGSLYIAGIDRMWRYDGATWQRVQDTSASLIGNPKPWLVPHADHQGVAFHAGQVYDLNDGGVYRFTYASKLWESLNGSTLIATQLYTIDQHPTDSNNFLVGSQDNGAAYTENSGTLWRMAAGGDVYSVRYSPNGKHAYTLGSILRWWNNSWDELPSATTMTRVWVYPFTQRPIVGGIGTLYEYQRDATWREIGPYQPGTLLRTLLFPNQYISAMAFSNGNNPNAFYVGTKAGSFARMNANWEGIVPITTGWGNAWITSIAVDPHNDQIIYLTANAPTGARIFRSIDRSLNWSSITTNLPTKGTTSTVIADRIGTTDVLYVSMQNGVFRGQIKAGVWDWVRLGTGLPSAPVTEIDLQTYGKTGLKRLAAATYGRGAWIIDLSKELAANNDYYGSLVGVPLIVPETNGLLVNDQTGYDDLPLHAVLLMGPTNGSLVLNDDGTFTYTPTNSTITEDSFTYYVTDGEFNSEHATVLIRLGANPVAADDSYSTAHDTELVVEQPAGVLANDTNPLNTPMVIIGHTNPSRGQLVLNANGSFAYTPEAGAVYDTSFTYTFLGNLGEAYTATVQLHVTNVAPTAVADAYTVPHDRPFNDPFANVLNNDNDDNFDDLTTQLVSGPLHGSLLLNADGSFTYTPPAGFTGTVSFTYRAFDGIAYSESENGTNTSDPPGPVCSSKSYLDGWTAHVDVDWHFYSVLCSIC